VRLLMPEKAAGFIGKCERSAAYVMREVASALSRAGFVVTTNGALPHDATVRVDLTFSTECGYGSGALAIEPGAVATFDDTDSHAITEAVRKLQQSAQVLALSRNTSSAGSTQGAGTAPAQAVDTLAGGGGDPRTFIAGTPRSDAYALIIGVEKYRDVPAPEGARADAQTFGQLAKSTLGVPESNVRVLLDERASKNDIERQLAWFKANVTEGGRLYFFFAGHGAPSADGAAYLMPYDAEQQSIESSGLKLESVLAELGQSPARDVIAFTDACFSGGGGRSLLPKGARPLLRVREATTPSRVALYAAATSAQISGPTSDDSAGLFTSTLADAIGDAQADIDGDGAITLAELEQWSTPRVERAAKRQNREQRPSLSVAGGTSASSIVVAAGLAAR
jgi:hypothetical protein